MSKTVTLADGTKAVIRELTIADVDKSYAFFQKLSPEERLYLRVDVRDREVVERRLKKYNMKNISRIAAFADDEIVGDAALEILPHGWQRHLGNFRIIVADDFRRKKLGMFMAEELYEIAIQEQVEEMIVELMLPQSGAKKIFERLGFHEEAVLRNMVKDINGEKQDLVIMRCSLDEIWDRIESYFEQFEGAPTREIV